MWGQHRRQQGGRQAVLLRGWDVAAPGDELEQRGPTGYWLRVEGSPSEEEALGEEPLRVRISRPVRQQEGGEAVLQEGAVDLFTCTASATATAIQHELLLLATRYLRRGGA